MKTILILFIIAGCSTSTRIAYFDLVKKENVPKVEFKIPKSNNAAKSDTVEMCNSGVLDVPSWKPHYYEAGINSVCPGHDWIGQVEISEKFSAPGLFFYMKMCTEVKAYCL